MLHFPQHPDYQRACRTLARRIADFERNHAVSPLAPHQNEATCIPRPEALANEVYQCLIRLNLKDLRLGVTDEPLHNTLRGDVWLNALRRLLGILHEMERLAAGEPPCATTFVSKPSTRTWQSGSS